MPFMICEITKMPNNSHCNNSKQAVLPKQSSLTFVPKLIHPQSHPQTYRATHPDHKDSFGLHQRAAQKNTRVENHRSTHENYDDNDDNKDDDCEEYVDGDCYEHGEDRPEDWAGYDMPAREPRSWISTPENPFRPWNSIMNSSNAANLAASTHITIRSSGSDGDSNIRVKHKPTKRYDHSTATRAI